MAFRGWDWTAMTRLSDTVEGQSVGVSENTRKGRGKGWQHNHAIKRSIKIKWTNHAAPCNNPCGRLETRMRSP